MLFFFLWFVASNLLLESYSQVWQLGNVSVSYLPLNCPEMDGCIVFSTNVYRTLASSFLAWCLIVMTWPLLWDYFARAVSVLQGKRSARFECSCCFLQRQLQIFTSSWCRFDEHSYVNMPSEYRNSYNNEPMKRQFLSHTSMGSDSHTTLQISSDLIIESLCRFAVSFLHICVECETWHYSDTHNR